MSEDIIIKKPDLRIVQLDWWDSNIWHNFIVNIFSKKYNVIVDEINPDIVIFSVFGLRHLDPKYRNTLKLFYTGENTFCNFNIADYGISFDDIDIYGRNFYYPLVLLTLQRSKYLESLLNREITSDMAKRDFASMVVSNSSGIERNKFFSQMCEYKKVSSGGRYMNNIGGNVADKDAFVRKYKFNICFENSPAPGYITEKIADAFRARTIPIYWGGSSEKIQEIFNKKAFIYVNDFKNFDEVIEYVKYLDNNDEAYLKMLREPVISDIDFINKKQKDLESFVMQVAEGKKKERTYEYFFMYFSRNDISPYDYIYCQNIVKFYRDLKKSKAGVALINFVKLSVKSFDFVKLRIGGGGGKAPRVACEKYLNFDIMKVALFEGVFWMMKKNVFLGKIV